MISYLEWQLLEQDLQGLPEPLQNFILHLASYIQDREKRLLAKPTQSWQQKLGDTAQGLWKRLQNPAQNRRTPLPMVNSKAATEAVEVGELSYYIYENLFAEAGEDPKLVNDLVSMTQQLQQFFYQNKGAAQGTTPPPSQGASQGTSAAKPLSVKEEMEEARSKKIFFRGSDKQKSVRIHELLLQVVEHGGDDVEADINNVIDHIMKAARKNRDIYNELARILSGMNLESHLSYLKKYA